MVEINYYVFCFTLLFLLCQQNSFATHTITTSQPLSDGNTLLSQGGSFEFGFFSPDGSLNRFIGIWYKRILVQTVVWVANRNSPVNDSSGVLKIESKGNLVLLDGGKNVVWSLKYSKAVDNPVFKLLDSGNLVLTDGKSTSYLWQSFDHPSDTLLPGMKLGWNIKKGFNRYLSAWKNYDDPSAGDFTYEIVNTDGYPEAVMKKGLKIYYRSGPWNGLRYSGSPDLSINNFFRFDFINNEDEVYYTYDVNNKSVISRLVLNLTFYKGSLQRLIWSESSQKWEMMFQIPRDGFCDIYKFCGAYSNCVSDTVPTCSCLKGLRQKAPQNWSNMDFSQGCMHEKPMNCTKGERFVKFKDVKLPDTTSTWLNKNMNLDDCKVECFKNCSCMAYTTSNISSNSGCVIWLGDLYDIRQITKGGQDIFIRMLASEIAKGESTRKRRVILIVGLTVIAVGLLLLVYFIRKNKRQSKGSLEMIEENESIEEYQSDDLDLPLFDFLTIRNATDGFSDQNRLGEGGYGPVYMGTLTGGVEIAVKRLSKKSIQGIDEFKNEVILISKLQHRNLVRILGCCIEGDEKMLIYEYMSNKSLDFFIFDNTRKLLLDWQTRFRIILGIARGLLYLHQDSRLRIIHRDLKASNILLDSNMDPKISDFGMARIFGRDQSEASTEKVVGTYGYMSPEYAIDGQFSVKSDVFSFGVLLLEIVSGKRNRGFYHPDHQLNLLGHAWTIWSEDKAIKLIYKAIGDSYSTHEVVRCVHVGLLCVQQRTEDRPIMSSVVLMLSSENAILPPPAEPGFFNERSAYKANQYSSDNSMYTSNDINMTSVEGR